MGLCPGDQMGLPRPPAFLDPSLDENVIFQTGVNFASGGGGILNETSSLFVCDHYIPREQYAEFHMLEEENAL